ncbi:MAG: hypothetical protein KDC48_00745 [Planctomycetes bacterium]|nr:hypothetical protein [Planctomycetota bacterium]
MDHRLRGFLRSSVTTWRAVLMTNFASTLQFVQGIHVWVDPIGAPTQFRLTDSAGRASVTLALPPNGALYGLQLYHQFFVLDPGGNGGLAAWTQGLSQTIGSW